jgi:uncharacterized membrane protein
MACVDFSPWGVTLPSTKRFGNAFAMAVALQQSVKDPVAAAQKEFVRLGMAKSPEQNGVLIFVAPRTHKFAVIGDAGVHAKCGDEFWRKLAGAMTGYFRKSEFNEGIVHGVKKAGELLAKHFPRIDSQ